MSVRLIEPEAARFDNTRIYIHKRSRKEGSVVDGRFVRIGRMFQLGVPDLHRRQFMGIHKYMFLTVSYPDYVKDLVGIATDLPYIPGYGPVVWCGSLACFNHEKSIRYFIQRNVWEFVDEKDFSGVIYTKGVISIVTGEGGGQYHLLGLPLLTRDFIRAKYKKVRPKNVRRKYEHP